MRPRSRRIPQRIGTGVSHRGRYCEHASHRCTVPVRHLRQLGVAVNPDCGRNSTVPAERRRAVPLWLMGMTNAPFGMYGGILVISVPELLNARHVPEATIS